MFRTLRVVPSLDLKGWVLEINGELIGPALPTAREAGVILSWLEHSATELDLLFGTDWEDQRGRDDENFDPVP